MGTSAILISAHRLTAARTAAKDGKRTEAIIVVGWEPDAAEGTGSSIQFGVKDWMECEDKGWGNEGGSSGGRVCCSCGCFGL
jgi:hypothetical protein